MSKLALVVDDSSSMRMMVRAALLASGFEVVEAENGQQGLDRLAAQKAKVNLIVTDLNMPVMDGISFIRAARALPAHRFTPILMLTTEAQDARKQEGKQAGATGWLVKPFHPDQLAKVVAQVVR
jgi:two-component system, chemotaxis family, chemotaxis protein CheY